MRTKKIIRCMRCGKEFEDKNFMPSYPLAVRVYCDKCLDEIKKEKITNEH